MTIIQVCKVISMVVAQVGAAVERNIIRSSDRTNKVLPKSDTQMSLNR